MIGRLSLVLGLMAGSALAQDLPPLPAGLGGTPALPAGLDPDQAAVEPTINATRAFDVTGFVSLRYGRRIDPDPGRADAILSEARAHLELDGDFIPFRFAADLVADSIDETSDGETAFDLREANVLLRPSRRMDIRLGRQILTWGTGDLIFINDLFPKDYVSFFAGRSDAYLKAPSDAARIGLFSDAVNLDLVVMSAANVDRSVDGERLSFTDFGTGAVRGLDDIATADAPTGASLALRAYRTFGAFEIAGYAYHGNWKSPQGTDPATGIGFYPDLSVYGASLRGPVAGGILSAELGYYDSRADRDGSDPYVANSDTRVLLGFEREIAAETTLGLQYYAARMQDYDSYLAAAPAGSVIQDETRDLVTLRLTRLALNQTLTATAFGFYSPTQQDSYLRLGLSYKPTDAITLDVSLGRFDGDRGTPFGQFSAASNLGLGMRYSF